MVIFHAAWWASVPSGYVLRLTLTVDVILHEDTHAHADTVLTRWVPVELLHTSITNQGGVQGGEIVTCTQHIPRRCSCETRGDNTSQ